MGQKGACVFHEEEPVVAFLGCAHAREEAPTRNVERGIAPVDVGFKGKASLGGVRPVPMGDCCSFDIGPSGEVAGIGQLYSFFDCRTRHTEVAYRMSRFR